MQHIYGNSRFLHLYVIEKLRLKFIRHKNNYELNEGLLIEEYRRTGNLESLGLLYEKYMPLVYGLCLKYYQEEEQSKDAVMQIFEQLINKLRVHHVSHFKSWLYTLARNHCLMDLRASGRYEYVSLDDNFVEKAEYFHLDINETKEQNFKTMENCLRKLPEEQRICINLFYLQQKCYKEVAEMTGFDMNKVKSYIQNGKRNLKICMEKNERDNEY